MNLNELRLYAINGSTLGVTTFTQIEDGLKIVLLLIQTPQVYKYQKEINYV